ncbi:AraC-type DNA-binding protein [Halobacillus karajensis]|uniref:helix-turn-helix domain-containing protein n=1 Tax=Halobacillus karajensis TaxID=195088 RepID=UPI0008A7ECF7|nr:helix-turn-helix domain-containing protein [Halobacillus karajensis]SEH44502.1 AraC-type DNA-binding protein [Halobacillus karajensis]
MTKYELINLLKDCSIALQTPVLLFNEQNELAYYFPDSFQKPPHGLRNLHKTYLSESRKHPFVIQLYKDPYDQYLFLYPWEGDQGKEYVIGIGPFLQQKVSTKHVRMNLVMNEISTELESQVTQYLEQLPVFNLVQVNSMKRLINQLLPQKEIEDTVAAFENEKIRKHYQKFTQSLNSYPELVASRQKFIDLFKKGDIKTIEEYQLYREKVVKDSNIRSWKNQMIRLVSELGYICVGQGAVQDEVDSLCDFYITFLETKETLDDLKSLELNILQSFLDRLNKVGDFPHNSPLVERAQRYIFQNLTTNLTLKGIAEILNVNPNYLSGVFTKERGVSITQFINQQRIKEAKELLCITQHSLMDISLLLGYNSQSYFTRVFKSIEGIGPKEFRQKYRSKEE